VILKRFEGDGQAAHMLTRMIILASI
jgi:hypothetical protein